MDPTQAPNWIQNAIVTGALGIIVIAVRHLIIDSLRVKNHYKEKKNGGSEYYRRQSDKDFAKIGEYLKAMAKSESKTSENVEELSENLKDVPLKIDQIHRKIFMGGN